MCIRDRCTRFFSGSRNRLWKYRRSNLSHSKCPHCVGHRCQPTFLQSEIKEEAYVKQPVGFENLDLSGQPYACKQKKSLYGLKQSLRNWHITIQHELITEILKACMCDPCAYVKDQSSSKVFIVLDVDDLLVTGSSEVGISKTKAFLMTKFAMEDLGDCLLYTSPSPRD